jgi:hypothetical protein
MEGGVAKVLMVKEKVVGPGVAWVGVGLML